LRKKYFIHKVQKHSRSTGINFINILCAHFVLIFWRQKLQSWKVTRESYAKHFCTKNAHFKCWWYWPQAGLFSLKLFISIINGLNSDFLAKIGLLCPKSGVVVQNDVTPISTTNNERKEYSQTRLLRSSGDHPYLFVIDVTLLWPWTFM